jgi:hypothetical protein
MKSKYQRLKFDNIKTYPISERMNKVEVGTFANPLGGKNSITELIQSLPDILMGTELREFIKLYKAAIREKKMIIWMIGAHTIKCGLNPIIIDLMKKGLINHLAMNGAGAIHDAEIAMWGVTSENVASGLKDGSFGMNRDTAEFLNIALSDNLKNDLGYAEIIAQKLLEEKAAHQELSILANAYQNDIPISLHPALGTEIIHQHPNFDGAAFGAKSLIDFQIFTNSLSRISDGSIILNVGSAVILPEVFLKALTIVRNLGFPANGFYSAVFDMNKHYRPTVNVMQRPTEDSGKGYYFIGHHEIMIPLLAAAIQ